MTKVMTKNSKINQRTTQENPRSIKNNSRVQDKNQEELGENCNSIINLTYFNRIVVGITNKRELK